jgi:hypothetical protein
MAHLFSFMRRQKFFTALFVVAAGTALFLSSCATPENRIAKHPEIYNGLGATDRGLVAQGKIREGMSKDAVYLAWGSPQQTSIANVRGKPADTWVYMGYTDAYPRYPYPYGFGYGFGYGGAGYPFVYGRHGRRSIGFYYDPFYWNDPFYYRPYDRISYPSRTVSFQNERVVAYQFLYPPRVGY